MVGLGSLKYNGEAPCKLNEARLLIYTDKECHKMLNETGNNDTLIKSAFCAGYLAGGIDACQVRTRVNYSFYCIVLLSIKLVI